MSSGGVSFVYKGVMSSSCRIAEDDGFEDVFSRSQMHIDERDEVALTAQQARKQKTRCVGGSWLFIVTSSMTTAIFIGKTHGYARLWAKFRQDHSCAHRALVPITSPRIAASRQGKRARVFLTFSSSPLSCKCIESNPLFK
jgi:hypothetical protein